MTHQETPGSLDSVAIDTPDALPTAVDALQSQTAEALANVPETALLNVLRALGTQPFFRVQAGGHLRADLNRTVWTALANAAGDFNLTIVQPSEERDELTDPKNTVRFSDGAEIALQIAGNQLTVFVKQPERTGFYPLTRRYIS